ncbi:DUF6969 family protein [Zobellella denitrificans]
MSDKLDTPLPAPAMPLARDQSPEEIATMILAGRRIRECYRVLKKGGLNVVGEVLKGQGTFYEMTHYPLDDVFDGDSHSQYYYHAHRGGGLEHGHFHTFLRAPGMPPGSEMLDEPGATEPWPRGDQAIAHLVAVSMDGWGFPKGLFACNRWVTGESWYPARTVVAMLDRFSIDHANPSWPVNVWLTQMLVLFRPHIEALLWHRDEAVAEWRRRHPGEDVFEDRRLEITGYLPISVDDWLAELQAELDSSS